MNHKIPITNPLHLKFIIQYAVSSAVRKLYQVDWEPRVVRQELREIKGGSLSFIDYAIPCFDLAQLLNKNVIDITTEISALLDKKLSDTSETEYFQHIKCEKISGYLNFEVKTSFLNEVVLYSSDWYRKPRKIAPSTKVYIGVLGYDINQKDQIENAMTALTLLKDAADLIHQQIEVSIELPNATSSVLDEIVASGHTATEPDSNNYHEIVKSKRELKKLVSFPNKANSFEADNKEIIDKLMRPLQTPGFSDQTGGHISQLSVAHSAESLLNRIITSDSPLNRYFVKDESSSALYLSNDDIDVPVRSSEGFLYPAAYMVEFIIRLAKGISDESIVLFAPHQNHALMHVIIQSILPEINYVLYDPMVSRSDIVEIIQHNLKLSDVFAKMSNDLSLHISELGTQFKRHEIFFMADFPMDISLAIAQTQIPLFFDILNQFTRLSNSITSDVNLD